MNKKDYTNLFTHISNDMNLIKISKINIYNTKNSLNTEYHELFTRGNSKIYKLFKDYNLGSDLELYLRLDMLTYLPFEKIGYDYLNNKLEKENSSVIEFKYNRIIKITSKFI